MSVARWNVLRFVSAYHAEHRRAPTVREIAGGLGRSPSTIHAHLGALAQSGHLERDPRLARATILARRGRDLAEDLDNLAISFELASAHETEFVPDGIPVSAEISRALRAAAFRGYALGLRRAGELVACAPPPGQLEFEGD
jgi:SOS-response transcriptional repressor LexA